MNIKAKCHEMIDRMVRRSALFRETQNQLFRVQREQAQTEKDNCELAERTAAIAQRLCRVSVQAPPDQRHRHLRVVIDIDAMILERGFLHGDDATVFEYIGRDIGARAAMELRRANFQRWEA